MSVWVCVWYTIVGKSKVGSVCYIKPTHHPSHKNLPTTNCMRKYNPFAGSFISSTAAIKRVGWLYFRRWLILSSYTRNRVHFSHSPLDSNSTNTAPVISTDTHRKHSPTLSRSFATVVVVVGGVPTLSSILAAIYMQRISSPDVWAANVRAFVLVFVIRASGGYYIPLPRCECFSPESDKTQDATDRRWWRRFTRSMCVIRPTH